MYKLILIGGFAMERYDDARKAYKGILMSGAIGSIVGALILMILLYLAAVLISAEYVPEAYMGDITVGSVFAGATVCAVVAVKRRGTGAMVTGLVAGVIYFAVIVIISALGSEGRLFGDMTLKAGISSVAGGAFGGALCINSKKKRHARRK
jgi:putative membrane protein (TIGR04086 family)